MSQIVDAPDTVTYAEAAQFLGIGMQGVYHVVKRGRLHSKHIKGSRLKSLLRVDVERYAIERHTSQSVGADLMMPGTLTYREAARFLGVKINSISPLVTRGRLHPISVEGSQVKRLSQDEVIGYSEQRGKPRIKSCDAPSEPGAMTYKEAARFLGISVAYLRNLVHRGHFQAFRVSEKGNAPGYLLRQEVERYADARDKTPASVARRSAQAGAALLVEALLWGVSDERQGGVQMRQRVLEQVARLRMTDEGREALAGLAAGIGDMLEGEPFKSAPSLATKRERLRQLHDAITGALAEPKPEPREAGATRSRSHAKPEPIKRPRSPSRHAGKPLATPRAK